MPEVLREDNVDGFHHCNSDDQLSQDQPDVLCYEQYRLESFANWPPRANVSKNDLAKDGFYYLNEGDKVKCAFCNVVLLKWERGDNIHSEHQRHSPRCPLILHPDSSGNIPYQQIQGTNHRLSQPKHPEYKDRALRVHSYTSWPAEMRQRPEQLAAAGFFYLGSGDAVKCYQCGGILSSWDKADVPWEEHKNWFPSCPLVLQNGYAASNDHRRFLQNSVACTARENGYSDDLLSIYDLYCEQNNIPYPETYNDLVDQLEQMRVSQETQHLAATETRHGQHDDVFTEIPEEPSATNTSTSQSKEMPRTTRRKTIQTQWSTDDRFQCKICYENHVEVIFLPCRHVCCCQSCCNKLKVKECPICRSKIKGMQPLYFA